MQSVAAADGKGRGGAQWSLRGAGGEAENEESDGVKGQRLHPIERQQRR